MLKHSILILMVISLTACVQSGRYKIKNDKAPLRKPTTIEMQNQVPIYEEIYPWSLKPYTVHGKRYVPLQTAKGYQEQGIASWYGRKFHGHTTANGEIYDMFAMTAAHKTLPIPSYVRVTNLANNTSIIVRVNDRGPFHPKRVIDLSYAAAYALDITSHGTANVHLESIVIEQQPMPLATENKNQPNPTITPTPKAVQQGIDEITPLNATVELKEQTTVDNNADNSLKTEVQMVKQRFVQVLASKNQQKIQTLAQQLSEKYKQDHHIPVQNGVYKLRLGPLQSEPQAQALIEALKNSGYSGAYMLYTEVSLPHN